MLKQKPLQIAAEVAAIITLIVAIAQFCSKEIKPGIFLKYKGKSGLIITENIVVVGPSTGTWPETLEDIVGKCLSKDQSKGTQLTPSNVGQCDDNN